jgi:hypothetical protein
MTAKYVSTNSSNKEIPAFEGDVRDQRSFTVERSVARPA